MEVIAKTADGLLIKATESEVREIINAVNGVKPEKVEIGQKIPAIDYAGTITKIKALKETSNFRNLIDHHGYLTTEINKFKTAVEQAANITV